MWALGRTDIKWLSAWIRQADFCQPARVCSGPGQYVKRVTAYPARRCSANRRSVLNTPIGPQRIETPFDLQRRVHANIALEALTVIAYLLDDVVSPVSLKLHGFAIVAVLAQQASDIGILGVEHLIDILTGNAHFFGVEHGKQRPLDDVEPEIVPLAYRRTQRLLGDDFRQNDRLLRLGQLDTQCGQLGGIGSQHITATRFVTPYRLLGSIENDGVELHVIGAEEVGHVELGGSPGLNTDSGTVEPINTIDAQLAVNHEANAVVERHPGEIDPQRGIAGGGPGGIARQQIHLARLQCSETD